MGKEVVCSGTRESWSKEQGIRRVWKLKIGGEGSKERGIVMQEAKNR